MVHIPPKLPRAAESTIYQWAKTASRLRVSELAKNKKEEEGKKKHKKSMLIGNYFSLSCIVVTWDDATSLFPSPNHPPGAYVGYLVLSFSSPHLHPVQNRFRCNCSERRMRFECKQNLKRKYCIRPHNKRPPL